ncbi:hypothetical protein K474DRAFT_1713553 [Panus rudis PR-1116 ss-1]|nr:hypothetical protein K474DRAFT_1713553 [Panus rudis PR-1116 ss-1]
MNTIAHAALGDSLWTINRKALERVRWFHIFCDSHTGESDNADVPRPTKRLALADLLNPITVSPSPGDSNPSTLTIEQSMSLMDLHGASPSTDRPGTRLAEFGSGTLEESSEMTAQPFDESSTRTNHSPPSPNNDYVLIEPSDPISIEPASESALDQSDLISINYAQLEDARANESWTEGDGGITDDMNMEIGGKDMVERDRDTERGSDSETEETEEDEDSEEEKRRRRTAKACQKRQAPAKAGSSRSTVHARMLNEQVDNGTFKADQKRLDRMKKTLSGLDPNAEIDESTCKAIRHPRCGKTLQMRTAYDLKNFRTHLKWCGPEADAKRKSAEHGVSKKSAQAKSKRGAGMRSITTYMKPAVQGSAVASGMTATTIVVIPCIGIAPEIEPLVETMLSRTMALGGGGRAVPDIAQDKYGDLYKNLSRKRQRDVRAINKSEWKWRNDHNDQSVHSVHCSGVLKLTIPIGSSSANQEPRAMACAACLGLLNLKQFKNALRVPMKADGNLKHIPHIFRGTTLGKLYAKIEGLKDLMTGDKPLVRYVNGVLSGKINNELFMGMLQALALEHDRVEQGKGMQNFRFHPTYYEFLHILRILSPQAFRFLGDHLPTCSERSLRYNEARQPRFPIGITERTFSLLIEHINMIDYNGPVCLCVDDTKLHPALRPFYDKDDDAFYILGCAGEPLRVADPDRLDEYIQDANQKKAQKLRLFCIQIPVPKVQPIIVAALSISNNANASELFPYSKRLITELISRGVHVAGYATDGATTERSVADLLDSEAPKHTTYTIPHPQSSHPAIQVSVPCFGPHGEEIPVVPLQDSKHGRKTYRNNAHSGSRLLVLGNEVMMHVHLRRVAFSGGPLFRRDVEEMDKQDDDSAERAFAEKVISWLSENHREQHLGAIIYLFIFGELVDAYQNREIAHAERVGMVLRTYFFVEAWENFLDAAGYSKTKHFLSRQACDIARRLVTGFLHQETVKRPYAGV